MKQGDIVRHKDHLWFVRRYDDTHYRVATLQNSKGETLEVPHDADAGEQPDCVVLGNPPAEWPYAIVKENPRGRFITGVTRIQRHMRVPLTMLVDWVPNDPVRSGGPMYFSPETGIQPAETLLISWSNGPETSLQIPVNFGSMGQRVSRANKKPAATTIYDRLLQDRFDGDD